MEEEGFIIHVDIDGMPETEYAVIPYQVGGAKRFKVLLDEINIGTLHKIYEDTWEWIDGEMTLADAETFGEAIEEHLNQR